MTEYKTREYYNKFTKEELVFRLMQREKSMRHQSIRLWTLVGLVRNYRTMLYKIRNQIDYLLEHPHSKDTGVRTKSHKRDIGNERNVIVR